MTDPKLPTVTYPGGLSPTEHAIQQAQAWMAAHTLANSPTPGSEYLIIRDLLGVALAKRERDADLQGRYDAGVYQGRLAQRETDARMCEARASVQAGKLVEALQQDRRLLASEAEGARRALEQCAEAIRAGKVRDGE